MLTQAMAASVSARPAEEQRQVSARFLAKAMTIMTIRMTQVSVMMGSSASRSVAIMAAPQSRVCYWYPSTHTGSQAPG